MSTSFYEHLFGVHGKVALVTGAASVATDAPA